MRKRVGRRQTQIPTGPAFQPNLDPEAVRREAQAAEARLIARGWRKKPCPYCEGRGYTSFEDCVTKTTKYHRCIKCCGQKYTWDLSNADRGARRPKYL